MWLDTPIQKDIHFVVGDDWSMAIALAQPASGLTFEAYIMPPSGAVYMGASTAGDAVSLSLAHDVTATIPAGVYPWQMSFTDQSGLRTTWFQGNATAIANV